MVGTWVLALVGCAFAYLILLAGGMNTVPSFSTGDAVLASPLLGATVVCAAVGLKRALHRGAQVRAWLGFAPPLAVAGFMLVQVTGTWFHFNGPRFEPTWPGTAATEEDAVAEQPQKTQPIPRPMGPPLRAGWVEGVDHLVLATPDLEAGLELVRGLLGVDPTPGGEHPAWGTRNYLVSLGDRVYLEILGPASPDPEVPLPSLFGIDRLEGPRLVAWAAQASDLANLRERALDADVDFGQVLAGRRQRPDGSLLSWDLTDPSRRLGDGAVPFLIDWKDSPHPASSSVAGGTLRQLRIEHPRSEAVVYLLDWLGLEGVSVDDGGEVCLMARIETAQGVVELR